MSRTDATPPRQNECPHADAAGREAEFDALLRKAVAAGEVGVIVRLCVPFRPEGELSGPREVAAQRAAIARAQDALLKRLVPFKTYRARKYEYTPLISMVVDADALRHLAASADVAGVSEDAALPTARD